MVLSGLKAGKVHSRYLGVYRLKTHLTEVCKQKNEVD
jgi:hypothetical protein